MRLGTGQSGATLVTCILVRRVAPPSGGHLVYTLRHAVSLAGFYSTFGALGDVWRSPGWLSVFKKNLKRRPAPWALRPLDKADKQSSHFG